MPDYPDEELRLAKLAAWALWQADLGAAASSECPLTYAFCHGVVATGKTVAAEAAVEEYRLAEGVFMRLGCDGYWSARVGALGGLYRDGFELEASVMREMVLDIERRHGAEVEEVAAVGPRQGQRVHVLSSYWRAHAAGGDSAVVPEEELHEKREGMYDKDAFQFFMSDFVRDRLGLAVGPAEC